MPTARRTTKAAAPAVEVEDEFEEMEELEDAEETDEADIEESDEDDDADLDELEEVEEEEAPAKPTRTKATKAKAEKTTTAKAPAIEFGSPWLAQHINEVVPGQKYDARSVRMLLRKLAKDGKLNREVGVERARYNFSGPEDATVKAVVAMVKSGEAKELKQAGLQAVKDKAAARKAAAKAAEAVEDEEIEEVEEAPKPARRTTRAASTTKATPAKATPAKATATTTRRKATTAK